MSFVYYNANPVNKRTSDCTVRAISKAMNQTWEDTYADLCIVSYYLHEMPSTNNSWDEYLQMNGFKKQYIPNTCPHCYTISDFCREHPYGTYILATGSHVVAVVNGNYYDTWDCGDEVPVFYWRKEI